MVGAVEDVLAASGAEGASASLSEVPNAVSEYATRGGTSS